MTSTRFKTLWIALLAPAMALASEQGMPGGGDAQSVLNDPRYRKPIDPPASGGGAPISLGCTNERGKHLKAGAPGYDECVARAQVRQDSPTPGGATQVRPNLRLDLGK